MNSEGRATIKDVARVAQVSTATVSHVLNHTRYVSDAIRQRVLAAMEILSYLGVRGLFDVVISAKDAPRLKPAPDVYLAALRQAGVDAGHAVAFEDSYSGCLAVHAAGMRVFGYTAGGENPQDLSRADYLVEDLSNAIGIIESMEREAGSG